MLLNFIVLQLMKQAFHKITSFLMALVVLFSTMSFTIDSHYCGDTLVDTSVFYKAETCGMDMQKPTPDSDCNITVKNCCSDEQMVVKGQNELKISFDKITFDQQLFVASFVFSYSNLFEGLYERVNSYSDYISPFVVTDIYKLDETYII